MLLFLLSQEMLERMQLTYIIITYKYIPSELNMRKLYDLVATQVYLLFPVNDSLYLSVRQ